MANYSIRLTKEAVRQIRRLPPQIRSRVQTRIDDLATSPRPPGCEKLQGSDRHFRVRVGDYRIIYQIEDEHLIITVVQAGHRRDIYRNLDRLP